MAKVEEFGVDAKASDVTRITDRRRLTAEGADLGRRSSRISGSRDMRRRWCSVSRPWAYLIHSPFSARRRAATPIASQRALTLDGRTTSSNATRRRHASAWRFRRSRRQQLEIEEAGDTILCAFRSSTRMRAGYPGNCSVTCTYTLSRWTASLERRYESRTTRRPSPMSASTAISISTACRRSPSTS